MPDLQEQHTRVSCMATDALAGSQCQMLTHSLLRVLTCT